jgi:hypothetical protein
LDKAETGMKRLTAMLSGLLLAFAAALPGAADARPQLDPPSSASQLAAAGCGDALAGESVRASEQERDDDRSGPAPDAAVFTPTTERPSPGASCRPLPAPSAPAAGLAGALYQARAPPRM